MNRNVKSPTEYSIEWVVSTSYFVNHLTLFYPFLWDTLPFPINQFSFKSSSGFFSFSIKFSKLEDLFERTVKDRIVNPLSQGLVSVVRQSDTQISLSVYPKQTERNVKKNFLHSINGCKCLSFSNVPLGLKTEENFLVFWTVKSGV